MHILKISLIYHTANIEMEFAAADAFVQRSIEIGSLFFSSYNALKGQIAGIDGIRQEFRRNMRPNQANGLTCNAAELNAKRNRYADIKCPDRTRVVLRQKMSITESDYINANWIRGKHLERSFIATQVILSLWLFFRNLLFCLGPTRADLCRLLAHGLSGRS